MEIIIHRINKINELKSIPTKYGIEIDIRAENSKLILNHEPYQKGDKFIDYIENYKHGTLIANIKEAGIEEDVIKIMDSYSINSFFLLDVEMPYLFNAVKKGQRNIAVRFSEYEDISIPNYFKNKLNWIWIDTVTKLPITKNNISIISNFKSCIVCPERWNREHDIQKYKKYLNEINFKPTAVMTSFKTANLWL